VVRQAAVSVSVAAAAAAAAVPIAQLLSKLHLQQDQAFRAVTQSKFDLRK